MLIKYLFGRGQSLRRATRTWAAINRRPFVTTRPLLAFQDGGEECNHNDLPLPEGDWQEAYNKKNSRNNMVLFGGIFAFALSIVLCLKSPNMEMNFWVPDLPEEEEPPKEEAPPAKKK